MASRWRHIISMSMSPEILQIGAVLQPDWDERPLRVIAFDDREVMYDCWWPHKAGWGFASLRGTITYYRVPCELLLKGCTYLRTEPLTQLEFDVHRPDLPLRIATLDHVEWPAPARLEAFRTMLISLASSDSLPATKLYLCPFGPNGGTKAGVLVEPEDGHAFGVAELLSFAAAIQAPHLHGASLPRGVGLFRLGIQRRAPSYYLWGSQSRAEAQE